MTDDDGKGGSGEPPPGRIDPSALAHFKSPREWAAMLSNLATDRSSAETLTKFFREHAEEENRRRRLICSDPRLRKTLDLELLDASVFTRGLQLYLENAEESKREGTDQEAS